MKTFFQDSSIMAARALVSSRLDYCNAVFKTFKSIPLELAVFENILARVLTICCKLLVLVAVTPVIF